jgi:hypothetical protein
MTILSVSEKRIMLEDVAEGLKPAGGRNQKILPHYTPPEFFFK